MLELKRERDSYCREKFTIKTSEGLFKIYYDPDLSLCWSPSIPDSCVMDNEYSYTITKENMGVYRAFSALYDSIITRRPFKNFKYDGDEKYVSYDDNNLVIDNTIQWHSDDFAYDAASVVKIDKDLENDNFIVTFKKSKVVCDNISPFSTFMVRFNTIESRYDPYNATFINMYDRIKEYCDNRKDTFSKKSWYKKKRVRTR